MWAASCDFDPRFVKPGIERRSARLQCPPPGRFRPVPPIRGICPCRAPPGFMPIVPGSFLMLKTAFSYRRHSGMTDAPSRVAKWPAATSNARIFTARWMIRSLAQTKSC